jgi:tetratricopeptide (TPR) repeat protein
MAENPRIEELRRRVLADPASIAFAALAEEFRRVGRYEEAVETCRTGLQRHPAYLSARVTLGRALIETGDYDGAREQLETVLRSAPENLAAIRGIAQINEHLGQSTEMDPHIADMMRTMHVESLRAAAERVPVVPVTPVIDVPAPVQPEPEPAAIQTAATNDLPVAPELSTESAAGASLAPPPSETPFRESPSPEAAAGTDAPLDVFASFGPASTKRAPVHDLSFDLSNAFSDKPAADRPPAAPLDFSRTGPAAEPATDPVHLPVERTAEPPMEPEPAFEPEHDLALEAGPDPEVLATLARLERFLGAIHSLRA